MIDRIGTRAGFAISVLLWSVAAMLHSIAVGPWSLAALRFALGIGEGGNWPAGIKSITEWIPKQNRAFTMGIFDGGSAVGAILAPPLVAWLTLAYGWRTTFLATGLLGLVWLVIWLLVYRPPAPAERGPASEIRISAWELLRARPIWGLFVTRFFATPVWWFYIFWLPDYLTRGRGLGMKQIALFGWIPYLAVDLGKLVGGWWSDWLLAHGRGAMFSRKVPMLAGAMLMTAGLLVVNASSAAHALAWVSLATFGFGVWSPNIFALHSDLFPQTAVARATGITGVGTSLGGALFTGLTGYVVQDYGYAPAFVIIGLAAPVACIALLTLVGPLRSGVHQ
jgi:ACS family hexuronate transporter-like MFS transporter